MLKTSDYIQSEYLESEERPFSRQEQKLLNLFALTIAWPPFSIVVNLSFYFFIVLIFLRYRKKYNPFTKVTGKQNLFYLFLILSVISTLIVPKKIIEERYASDILLLFNYTYWIFISLFFISNSRNIDILAFARYYFIGSIFLIVMFFVPNVPKINTLLFEFPVIKGRNVFVYQLVNIVPVAVMYLYYRFSRPVALIAAFLYLVVMFLTKGRAGSIILIIVFLLVCMALYPEISRLLKWLCFGLIIGFFVMINSEDNKSRNKLADMMEGINPRLSEMIRDVKPGATYNDESWLTREMMVRKSLAIVKEHPVLGIGINRFRNYEVDFTDFFVTESKFKRLRNVSYDQLNDIAPHNSYIQIMAENGFLGLLIFIMILFYPLKNLIVKILKNRVTMADCPQIAFFGLVIYLYAISSYPTAITFVTIALAYNRIE